MTSLTTLDATATSVGYLLPTRDAITLGRPQAEPLLALAARAETLGFDAVWVGDSPLARARHDALTMLAAVAARTSRVTVGTAVLLAALRAPLLLAQALATLDQIAAGRLILGVGAGFPFPETERQFEAVGVPYAGRVTRMTETVAAIRALWSAAGEPVTQAGRHVTLEDVSLQPPPYRAGGPAVWFAGAGEAAEQRVGRLADGWLPYPPTAEQYAEGWTRVRSAAAEAGRASTPLPALYATVAVDDSAAAAQERLRRNIERYYGVPLEIIESIQATRAGTPADVADWLQGYIQAGARHIVLRVSDEDAERGLETAAAVRELLTHTDTEAA
jgi:alkanesulfonate monooxygenase SsuD/methylene tetrahydromethanopterin reductase-like flavin-dependent oxidoreductase (luciferase family)